ncbi:hypothetical protein SANTM175S_09036 [Streptomyces antimycoticus]
MRWRSAPWWRCACGATSHLARRGLNFLDLDGQDKDLLELVTTGLSPLDLPEADREARLGECLYRDLLGRVGTMKILIPADPEAADAIHTTPTREPAWLDPAAVASGTAPVSGALLLGALVATTVVLLTSTPALAAPPTPTPSPAATAPATPTPSDAATSQARRVPHRGGEKKEADRLRRKFEKFWDEQHDVIGESMQKELLRQEQKRIRDYVQDEGGVLGVFNTTDKYGIPVSTYSVDGDTGSWYQWDLGVWNLLTSLCFMLTKWLIAFSCWMVAWALSFGLAKILLKPVLAVAESLHTRVIMELGLPTLFLTVCALICAWNIFFGDRPRGWGDAALSILLAALTATAVITPPSS